MSYFRLFYILLAQVSRLGICMNGWGLTKNSTFFRELLEIFLFPQFLWHNSFSHLWGNSHIHLLTIIICNTSYKFWDQPPSPIINDVCKYLRQFDGTSFSLATLPIYCNIERGGAWFFSTKWTILEFPEIFLGIELISIIYVRFCHKIWGS